MSGFEFDLVRYYVEDGAPTEERVTFRDTDRDDPRSRPISDELLALVGADGIDRAWVWTAAQRAGFDVPNSIVVGEATVQGPNGPETAEHRAFPDQSDYWNVLALPPRRGVRYIDKDEYERLVITASESNLALIVAYNQSYLDRVQASWDATRKLHLATGISVEESTAIIGPRPEG